MVDSRGEGIERLLNIDEEQHLVPPHLQGGRLIHPCHIRGAHGIRAQTR